MHTIAIEPCSQNIPNSITEDVVQNEKHRNQKDPHTILCSRQTNEQRAPFNRNTCIAMHKIHAQHLCITSVQSEIETSRKQPTQMCFSVRFYFEYSFDDFVVVSINSQRLVVFSLSLSYFRSLACFCEFVLCTPCI